MELHPLRILVLGLVVVHFTGGRRESLSLRGPIFIAEPPDRVDFSNTTGATLECSVHGHPAPSVRWVHADGSSVDDIQGIRHVLANGSLVFLPFRAELYRQDIHAGRYLCLASSPLGVIRSRPVYVRAVVQQYYEVQVYDEFVILGNIAVLKCHIPPFVREHVQVTSWIRNHNVHIRSAVSNSGSRFAMLSTGELYVYKVSNEDSMDTFRCQTMNRLTQEVKLSAPGRIIVSDPKSSIPPRIIHSHAMVAVIKGEVAELPCVAQGLPVPIHAWYRLRDSEHQMIKETERIEIKHGLLLIRNSQITDAGVFVCKASNLLGEEKYETILSVNEPLSVFVEPQEVTADVGQQVSFTCVASGHPITSVEWLKDGQILQSSAEGKAVHENELTIKAVDGSKRGMYQCIISNDESAAQGTAELRLGAIPPEVTGKFPNSPVNPQSSVELQCVVKGSPIPLVTWYLDEGLLTFKKTMSSDGYSDDTGNFVSIVKISPVQVSDSGYYKCVATNDAGEVEYSKRLDVIGTVSIKKMSDISATRGSDLKVICSVIGYPISSITWKKDGNVLPSHQRQKVFANGTLLIQKLSKTMDEGIYTCFAKGDGGKVVHQVRTIRIAVPPVIDANSFPTHHNLHLGTRARLQCVLTEGDLPLTIRWLKDGKAFNKNLPVSIRKEDDFASVLTIVNITAFHQGNYTCIANNNAASVNITTQIVIEVPPYWLVQPSDMSAVHYSDVILNCSAGGSPSPSIVWKKSGRFFDEFVEVPVTSTHLLLLPNGSLFIRHLTEKDEGKYLCDVNNGVGLGLSKIIEVDVQVPPYIEAKYQNKTARRGDNVQLECRIHGDSPVVVIWSKDGYPVKHEDNERVNRNDYNLQEGQISELIIYRADRQDVGVYTCVVSNSYGKDEGWIYFHLREPPEPPEDLRIIEHTSQQVHLSWSSAANLNAGITRFIVQYKLSSDEWTSNIRNISLPGMETSALIDGLRPGTSYTFRILAGNELGFGDPSSSVTVITVEEVPSGTPVGISVETAGPNSLLIKWKAPTVPEMNGELQGYYVGYKVHNAFGPFTYKTVESNKVSGEEKAILGPLLKYTNYSIIVQAFNRAGAGPPSAPVIALTDEDVPSEAPQNVMCKATTSQRLFLSWNSPPPHSQNGIIIGYKVLYSPENDDEEIEDETYEIKITSSTDVILHDLEKWTNYSVVVLAFTKAGDGKRSPSIHCQTMEDVPAAPSDVKALAITSTSIFVTWRQPYHANGIVKKYTVYMRHIDSKNPKTLKFTIPAGKQLQYEVKLLHETWRYEFWVTASTSVGEGESTKVVSQTPKSDIPARIATFEAVLTDVVNRTIILPCTVIGTPVTSTTWKFGEIILQESRFAQSHGDNFLRLSGIQRNNSGNYTCSAKNNLGSDKIIHVLLVTAPPSPPVLKVISSTTSTIHLMWKLQDDGGTSVKGFVLHYKREFDEWETIRLKKSKTTYSLSGLRCGTEYWLHMTSFNKIGTSEPTNVITVRTNGSVPGMPALTDVLRANTTSVELLVASWPDNGCIIRYFVVQYLDPVNQEWVLVSNSLQPNHEFIVISDLQSGALYKISVTAHNDAGTTVAHYDVWTLPLYGVLPGKAVNSKDQTSYFTIFAVIVPVSILMTALMIIVAIIAVVKYRKHCNLQAERSCSNNKFTNENPQNFLGSGRRHDHQTASLPRFINTANNRNDVCPYATSNIMDPSRANIKSAYPLRTFGVGMQSESNEMSSLCPKEKLSPQRQSKEGMLILQQKVPSVKELYNLYQTASEQQLYQHCRGGDQFASDWNLKCDSNRLSCPYQERPQVPDLLYHGTDSSTPNESSPEELRWPSHHKDFTGWDESVKSPHSLSSYPGGDVTHLCALGYPNCQCQINEIKPGEKFYSSFPTEGKLPYNDDGTIRV